MPENGNQPHKAVTSIFGAIPQVLREANSDIKVISLVALLAFAAVIVLAPMNILNEAVIYSFFGVLLFVLIAVLLLTRFRGEPAPSETDDPAPTVFAYDAFISAPMDGFKADENVDPKMARELHNENMRIFQTNLRKCCRMDRTFYAGLDMPSRTDYDDETVGLKNVWTTIRQARLFILIYPKRSASSIIFEAGMAIALGKPSFWFVKRGERLPYLMRGYQASLTEGLPLVRIIEYDAFDEVIQKLQNNGAEIFSLS